MIRELVPQVRSLMLSLDAGKSTNSESVRSFIVWLTKFYNSEDWAALVEAIEVARIELETPRKEL